MSSQWLIHSDIANKIYYGQKSKKIEKLYDKHKNNFSKLKLLFLDSPDEKFDKEKLLPKLIELCPDDPMEIAKLFCILPKWMSFQKYNNSPLAQEIVKNRKWFDLLLPTNEQEQVVNEDNEYEEDSLLDQEIWNKVADIIWESEALEL